VIPVVDPGDDFEEVIAAARLGAEWALVALYRSTQPGLIRYLYAHAPGEEEDLASEVWLQVAQSLAGFEGGREGFRRFVFTIARRRVVDYRRQRARRRTDPADNRTMGDLRDRANTEVSALERVGGGEAVARILALLPAEQAEVILLRVVAGLSVAEVAQVIGRRPAAVSVLQHRALRRLADRLRPSDQE